MPAIELYHFEASHFNEKARWALDWKLLQHKKTALLPGFHLRPIKKLTGNSQVPVLRYDDAVIQGSAQIIQMLEEHHPRPALYPEDPDLRQKALEIQTQFDAEVGPAIRLAKFFEVLDVVHAKATFGRGAPWLQLTLWGILFPLLTLMIKRSYGINPDSARRARQRTNQAFDFVAKQVGPKGYLVGDHFSVADLCCASLLMVAVDVGQWGGPPSSGTEKNQRWLESWADHPGTEWVCEIYRRHRLPKLG